MNKIPYHSFLPTPQNQRSISLSKYQNPEFGLFNRCCFIYKDHFHYMLENEDINTVFQIYNVMRACMFSYSRV